MIAWLTALAAAQSLYLVPEVELGAPFTTTDGVTTGWVCALVECPERRMLALTYGATLISDNDSLPFYVRVRRKDFLRTYTTAQPYTADLRVGVMLQNADSWGMDSPWYPNNQTFVFGGVYYNHHFGTTEAARPVGGEQRGNIPPLGNALHAQIGVLSYYSGDGFPTGTAGYTELAYLRALASNQPLNDWSDRNGLLFRFGMLKGPFSLGGNVTFDPNRNMWLGVDFGFRMGIGLN